MERPEHGAHPDFLYDKDPNDPTDNERGERIFPACVAELEQKFRDRATAAQAKAP